MNPWLMAIALLFAALASAARAEQPDVRVRIVTTLSEARLALGGPHALHRDTGPVMDLPAGALLRLRAGEDGVSLLDESTSATLRQAPVLTLVPRAPNASVTIDDVPFGVGWWWESSETRTYEATLEARVGANGRLYLVAELPLEEYLRGVVPNEIGPTAPAEAQKAQAVAARSETVTALRERVYADEWSDICADVDCQVFAGTRRRNPATDAAIRATRGLVLAHGGESIPAYYASNSGGYTEDVGNVWPERDRGIPCWSSRFDGPGAPPPDLRDEANLRRWIAEPPPVYANPDVSTGLPEWTRKNFRWAVTTPAADLSRFLAEAGHPVGRVTAIEPLERGPSGRLLAVRFHGEDGTAEVGPELAIRRIWQPPLRSAAFVVDPVGDPALPDAFTLRGAGYGHGVGMCQTGAMGRALSGQDFRQILTFYYKDADITRAY